MSKSTRSPHNPQKRSRGDEEPVDYEPPEAWERYDIQVLDDNLVRLHWSTNDNLDYGRQTRHASFTRTYTGEDALAQAKKATGVSRQGVGYRVYVTLDGKVI